MKASFAQTFAFAAEWSRMGLTDADLQALELQVMADPTAGAAMAGTGGLRKIRFAPPSMHRGKRGATRVCYLWIGEKSFVWLIAIYAKNEKDNLSKAERNEVAKVIARLRESMR